MSMPTIAPAEAQRLAETGARLIDIRSPDEFARSNVPGAENHPLGSVPQIEADRPVIFMCRSGMRTRTNAGELRKLCQGEAYLLEGGIEGWRKAGLPLAIDRSQPLDIMRQVQIAAGSLVLVGLVFGIFYSPWWLWLSAFVGGGLTFAGITGWCGMAMLLARMPWNRATSA